MGTLSKLLEHTFNWDVSIKTTKARLNLYVWMKIKMPVPVVEKTVDILWWREYKHTHRSCSHMASVFPAPPGGRCAPELRDSSPNADRADRSSCGVTAAAAALAHCVSLIFIWFFSSHVELLIQPHLISLPLNGLRDGAGFSKMANRDDEYDFLFKGNVKFCIPSYRAEE